MSKYVYYKPVNNSEVKLLDIDGVDATDRLVDIGLEPSLIDDALANDQVIEFDEVAQEFKRVDSVINFQASESIPIELHAQPANTVNNLRAHDDIVKFIQTDAVSMRPDILIMDDLVWKYLVRSVIRSQNILMTGPTGSGKTMAVRWLVESLNRPLFSFNMGSMQDPRSSLIGNTHFDSTKGTYFSKSPFISAIQTPHAVILLDEVSRANPEAFNILMTVLDINQRFVRIDEASDTPTIKVHPTVTFIGTANIGIEYSATRVIDRALMDRFVTVNMEYLDEAGEVTLLTKLFPTVAPSDIASVAKIVTLIRHDAMSDDSHITNALSTRHSIEITSLLNDGFTLSESVELIVYPQFDSDGGVESDRTFVKQLIQSQFDENMATVKSTDMDERELFNTVCF